MNNYIFDLDGTLIDSSNEVLLCLKKAYQKADYEINENALNSNIIGPPLREIIKSVTPNAQDNKIDEIISNFRYYYDNEPNDISTIYENVHSVLQKLSKTGKNLYLATFKPMKPTLRIISQFNLDYFDEIYTIDKFNQSISKEDMINMIITKYGLDKKNTCMIGDAPSDMIAAKKTGIYAYAALWGYGENKENLINNADVVLKSIEELCQK